MATSVVMPQLGESVMEGTLVKWHKREGERIKKDEVLYEVSTDKVDSEIPSPADGIVKEIKVQEGEKVPVKAELAVIEETTAESSTPSEPQKPEDRAGLKKEDVQELKQSAPEEEMEQRPRGEKYEIEVGKEVAEAKEGAGEAAGREHKEERPDLRVAKMAAPFIRKMAKEQNIDLEEVSGTGTGGRVTKNDILSFVDQRQAIQAHAAPSAAQQAPSTPSRPAQIMPQPAQPQAAQPKTPLKPGQKIEQLSHMRRQIADHMIKSQQSTAHVTNVVQVDMSLIADILSVYKEDFKAEEGFSLTYLPFVAKAAIEALKDYPMVNARLRNDSEVILSNFVNLGIAVSLGEEGLIVPVIKNADELNVTGLARAINKVAKKARSKQLSVDDVEGGTFSITNQGVFGSIFSTPIINYPEAAILSLETVTDTVVATDGTIAIKPMTYLPLTWDHRLIDGVTAALFLQDIKDTLESWDARAPID